jgi:hypothetical protein
MWLRFDVERCIDRALAQGRDFKTVRRRGGELKLAAVDLAEMLFRHALPGEDINGNGFRDYVRLLGTRAFFALLKDADRRITCAFDTLPELLRLRELAARSMYADARWPKLELVALSIDVHALRLLPDA